MQVLQEMTYFADFSQAYAKASASSAWKKICQSFNAENPEKDAEFADELRAS